MYEYEDDDERADWYAERGITPHPDRAVQKAREDEQ